MTVCYGEQSNGEPCASTDEIVEFMADYTV